MYEFHKDEISQICTDIQSYANLLVRRGYVCNTLGNISVRLPRSSDNQDDIVFTKCSGVSLEEMTEHHLVGTTVSLGDIVYGRTPPSIGHQLSREIYKHRPDIQSVIHLHPNQAISFFCANPKLKKFPFISADAPLVLGAYPSILDFESNIEEDVVSVKSICIETNVIIMPNHGVTAYGRSLSQAYHRFCTTVSEIDRFMQAQLLVRNGSQQIHRLDDKEVDRLFSQGDSLIYNKEMRDCEEKT